MSAMVEQPARGATVEAMKLKQEDRGRQQDHPDHEEYKALILHRRPEQCEDDPQAHYGKERIREKPLIGFDRLAG